MIQWDESAYSYPEDARRAFPLGEEPFSFPVSEIRCCAPNKTNEYVVSVMMVAEPIRGRPFYGGLVFLNCERCGTLFVTRLPKPSER